MESYTIIRRLNLSRLHAYTASDLPLIAAPLIALSLWVLSLPRVDVGRMNDLGLVSALPPTTFVALAILILSFGFAVQTPKQRTAILLLHLGLLILMLYGVTALVEEMPRFDIVYRHAGFTEYITRTGGLDPDLDAYFNWPGFFIFSALLVKTLGVPSILSFAAWSPFVLNLLAVAPLYSIFSSLTSDKRLVWLGIWVFMLTNWIGQDYYSPQGFVFLLYLVIIAIFLRWFTRTSPSPVDDLRVPAERLARGVVRHLWLSWVFPPQTAVSMQNTGAVSHFFAWLQAPKVAEPTISSRRQIPMLICLLAIFGVVVCSHPLTPFFVLISVTGLVILRGYRPRWLPLVLAAMTVAWIFFMTRAYLAGHLAPALGEVGKVDATVGASVFGRIVGSPGHVFITLMRVAMTALIWLLAVSGFFARLRSRQQDATVVILGLAPFLMIIAQSYGGEILLRIYLFGLPAVAFLVAGLIFPSSKAVWSSRQAAVTIALSLVLLGGFVFTRYGNERNDYMSVAEVAGMRQLYRIASPGDLLVDVSEGAPWKFQQLEQFDYMTLMDTIPKDLAPPNVIAIAAHIRHDTKHTAYLIITRSQAATLESTTDLPPGALDRLEIALVASHQFKLIYHNQDVRIYVFTGGPP